MGVGVIAVATILGATAYGMAQVPTIHEACKKMHACGPGDPPKLAPLNTDWLGSGATWDSAAHDTLEAYRREYPDFEINYVPGREYQKKDWGTPYYRFEMTFVATPKWTGIFA
jgi:hypothetical protein